MINKNIICTGFLSLLGAAAALAFPAGVTIEAENFTQEGYPQDQDDVRIMTGKVGYIKYGGNYIDYNGVNFGNGSNSVTFNASSGHSHGGIVNLSITDPSTGLNVAYGSVTISSTGSFSTFQNFTSQLSSIVAGVKNVRLTFDQINRDPYYMFDLNSLIFTPLTGSRVGFWNNAADFTGESQSANQDIIRKMGNKVGYIKNGLAVSMYEYFMFDSFNLQGAKSVTIRYSSGGSGGALSVNSQSFYSNQLATVSLPNTGGWNNVQEVTVNVNQGVVSTHGTSRMLVFSIYEGGQNTGYKYDIHSFRFNDYVAP
jgi:Carbohydrate binding module (family 6)